MGRETRFQRQIREKLIATPQTSEKAHFLGFRRHHSPSNATKRRHSINHVLQSAPDVQPLDLFLAELAISSNVTRSAAKAGLTTAQVYMLRQRDPAFDRAWRAALCAGYEMLELAMLEHLAKGEIKGGKSAKGVRVVDVANGMRLLAAHRETVARERAIRDERDEDQVRASLNAKLNELRRRMGWDQVAEGNAE